MLRTRTETHSTASIWVHTDMSVSNNRYELRKLTNDRNLEFNAAG